MAEPAGPFHLLRAGPGRYLCYCRPGPGPGGTVYVTDALEVWAGELGARPPLGCRCQPEEHGTKLREALGRGAAWLSLAEGKARLELREEETAARCSALDLFKLPVAEARSQLQALVFGMAGCIESLERRLEVVKTQASSCSPEKNVARSQQLFLTDPSPRKNRSAGLVLPARRKIPGESLINPGFKSKKVPSGVDFEDS
ncbi:protein PAXX isoform X2 [Nyctibius grandis]|uniref:protein PAXX isoform X2 n=1 Tax=Nyctibius grandis TaxID=48427 RepID=UPI0035BBB903